MSKDKRNPRESKKANKVKGPKSKSGDTSKDGKRNISSRSTQSSRSSSSSKSAYRTSASSKSTSRLVRSGRKTKIGTKKKSHQLEIYFKYTSLDNATLVSLLEFIDRFTALVIDEYEYISDWKVKEGAKLQISYISTGQSITIRWDGGWLPSVKVQDGDIIVNVNGKIALPVVILTALLHCLNMSADLTIKYYEVLNKRLEHEEKLEAKEERKVKAKAKQQTAQDFLDSITSNSNITYFRINNTVIKK